jgi:hypothetical protein
MEHGRVAADTGEDPALFHARKRSLVCGGPPEDGDAAKQKGNFETDFWICSGLLLIVGIVFLGVGLAIWFASDSVQKKWELAHEDKFKKPSDTVFGDP